MLKSTLIIGLVFVLNLRRAVDGAASILPPQKKPAEFACQKGCYVPELDTVLPVDKPYSPKDGKTCIQYTCDKNGYTSIYTCGVIGFDEEVCWLVPGNLYLGYPDCCDDIQCQTTTTTTTTTKKSPTHPTVVPTPIRVYPQPVQPAKKSPKKKPIYSKPGPSIITPAVADPPVDPVDDVPRVIESSTTSTSSERPPVILPKCPPRMTCLDPIESGPPGEVS